MPLVSNLDLGVGRATRLFVAETRVLVRNVGSAELWFFLVSLAPHFHENLSRAQSLRAAATHLAE